MDEWNNIRSKKYIGKEIYPQNAIFSKLFQVNYYLILDDDKKIKSDLLSEMHFNLKYSKNNFAFYCFTKLTKRKIQNLIDEYQYYFYANDDEQYIEEYFLFCFEGNCYIFDTKSEDFKNNLLFLFNTGKEILLIGSTNDDVLRIIQLFNMKEGFLEQENTNKIYLLNEKNVINEIEIDINTIMNEPFIIGINNQLKKLNQSIYDIIKILSFRIIMTYSIRRFYFPINFYSDPSFFGKEREFLEITENNYKNISSIDQKYQPQQSITIKEMNINDFIILRAIGRGSNTTIYLAFHIYEEQLLIIKKFNDYDYFEKEKDNYLRLKYYHPNIIKCYGYAKDCLIIEFMCNETLQNFLKIKSSPKTIFSSHFISPITIYTTSNYFHELKYNFLNNHANKIKMIIELVYGLQYLHLNDMIYFDLKPDNIFIDHNFMIRLGDFDLSCSNEFLSSKSNKLNDLDSINYFSPDISFSDDGIYTYASDNFQLGLVIYAICTGKDLLNNVSVENNQQLNKVIKNKQIPFLFGPFCSFLNRCLKTSYVNRVNLCNAIVEFSKYQTFFHNLSKETVYNFYYSDIVKELHMLNQNLHEILYGFVKLFTEEILTNNKENEKRNVRQMQFVLENLFIIPSLKEVRNKLAMLIQTITFYIDQEMQTKKNKNTNKRIEYVIKLFYRSLYFIYSTKDFCLYDIQKASNYLLQCVNKNDYQSQYILALNFFDGSELFKKNLNNAILFFTLSAELGYEISQYNLGEIYSSLYDNPIRIQIPRLNIDTNNKLFFKNQALKYYKLAKKQNYSPALYALAVVYNNGDLGIKKNKKKAIMYLTRSKNNFYEISINTFFKFFSVGLIYTNYDASTFEKEAVFLSDSFNNVVAQYELGNFYLKHMKNIEKAKKYFNLAAEQKHRYAITSLANIYLDESKKVHSIELQKKAFDYFLRAADLNEPAALYYVARRYFLGDKHFVKRNIPKSLNLLQRAFALNSSRAQKFLGFLYLMGYDHYVIPNSEKAINCFQLASENPFQRDKDSMDILGLIYLEGKIKKRNINLALKYFKDAKNLNSSLSTHQLGFLYEIGEKRLNNENYVEITYVLFGFQYQIYMLYFSYFRDLDDLDMNDDLNDLKSIPNLAIQYYKESFFPYSLYNLAAIYYSGIYVKRDVFFAISLLEKIAQFLQIAAFFLYLIYSNGEYNLVKKDEQKAAYYLKFSGNFIFSKFLTIDVLKNSRFFFKMIYYQYENKNSNKSNQKNINKDFYEGFLSPKINDPSLDDIYRQHT